MTVFSVHRTADDVEALMGAVAGALRQWEGGESPTMDLSMIQGQAERLTERARQLTAQWNVDGNAIIHSQKRIRGPWLIRFQLLVRRLTWWFLWPILQQIRLFQMNTAHVVDGMAQNQAVLIAHVTKMSELERRLGTLEAQVVELQQPDCADGG